MQGLGDELAVLVEIFDALGNDARADAIHIDLAHSTAGKRRQNVRRAIDDGLVHARRWRDHILALAGWRHIVGRRDRVAFARLVNLHRIAVEVRVGEVSGRAAKVDQRETELRARGCRARRSA